MDGKLTFFGVQSLLHGDLHCPRVLTCNKRLMFPYSFQCLKLIRLFLSLSEVKEKLHSWICEQCHSVKPNSPRWRTGCCSSRLPFTCRGLRWSWGSRLLGIWCFSWGKRWGLKLQAIAPAYNTIIFIDMEVTNSLVFGRKWFTCFSSVTIKLLVQHWTNDYFYRYTHISYNIVLHGNGFEHKLVK